MFCQTHTKESRIKISEGLKLAYQEGRKVYNPKGLNKILENGLYLGNAFKNAKIEIKCEVCGNVFNSFKGNKRKFCSRECFGKAQRELQKGENCNFWKGGITKLSKQIRESLEYKNWRLAIYKRDNWTCQNCGNRGSIELEAHHTPKSFSELLEEYKIKTFEQAINCKELFNINKGVTFCKDCHGLTFEFCGNQYIK